jgi:hypothetical protein
MNTIVQGAEYICEKKECLYPARAWWCFGSGDYSGVCRIQLRMEFSRPFLGVKGKRTSCSPHRVGEFLRG